MNTTKAIILAAGRSSRLYPITLEKPKCLLELGGKPIIQWQIETLRKIGVSDIVVVVGYKKEVIMGQVGDAVRYRVYEDFDKTNNLHTLYSIRDELDCDCLCLFSDVLTDLPVLKKVSEGESDFNFLVNTKRVRDDTIRIVKQDGLVTRVGSHLAVDASDVNYLGICKLSKNGGKLLSDQMEQMVQGHHTDYFTLAIDELAILGAQISPVELDSFTWIEVDTENDLLQARENFHKVQL